MTRKLPSMLPRRIADQREVYLRRQPPRRFQPAEAQHAWRAVRLVVVEELRNAVGVDRRGVAAGPAHHHRHVVVDRKFVAAVGSGPDRLPPVRDDHAGNPGLVLLPATIPTEVVEHDPFRGLCITRGRGDGVDDPDVLQPGVRSSSRDDRRGSGPKRRQADESKSHTHDPMISDLVTSHSIAPEFDSSASEP